MSAPRKLETDSKYRRRVAVIGQKMILDLFTMGELATLLGVSEKTFRQDLKEIGCAASPEDDEAARQATSDRSHGEDTL